MNRKAYPLLLLIIFCLASCSTSDVEEPQPEGSAKYIQEVEVLEIKLPKPASLREFEASGLAWYKAKLVFLPQYPHLFSDKNDGLLYYAEKSGIKKIISGESISELEIVEIPFIAEGLDSIGKARGSGYEAIIFDGNDAYLSIESIDRNGISSYLVKGKVHGDLDSIVVDSSTLTALTSQTGLHNMGEEAITVWHNRVYAFHEANGANLIDTAKAFSTDFPSNVNKIRMPSIEYRVTDATSVDESGKFWVMNYFFPGESAKLNPAGDPLVAMHGIGETNDTSISIERIIELRITNDQIQFSKKPPVYIKIEGIAGRNWEGIVKLDNEGFLIISDYFPKSIFGFVPVKL